MLGCGLVALVTFGCASVYHGAPVLVAKPGASLYRGGQPASQADVTAIGFKFPCVFYRLSADGEGGVSFRDESLWVHTAGCAFIPEKLVSYPFPSDTGLRAAAEAIQCSLARGASVYVHCWRGKDRTGGAVAAWQILYTDLPLVEILRQRAAYLSGLDKVIDAGETHELREIAKGVGK